MNSFSLMRRCLAPVLVLPFLLAACADSAEQGETPYMPVGDLQQLMAGLVEPAAEVYWDAVGVIVDSAGEHQMAPQNEEEWLAVRAAAYTVAESGNLLILPGNRLDNAAWVEMSRALVEVGTRAIEAADARSLDAVFDMGAEMYYVCTNCHATYAVETLRPTDPRLN
jgi:hypothetical protein